MESSLSVVAAVGAPSAMNTGQAKFVESGTGARMRQKSGSWRRMPPCSNAKVLGNDKDHGTTFNGFVFGVVWSAQLLAHQCPSIESCPRRNVGHSRVKNHTHEDAGTILILYREFHLHELTYTSTSSGRLVFKNTIPRNRIQRRITAAISTRPVTPRTTKD